MEDAWYNGMTVSDLATRYGMSEAKARGMLCDGMAELRDEVCGRNEMSDTLTRDDLSFLNGIVAEAIAPSIRRPGCARASSARPRDTPQNTRTVRANEGRWHRMVPGVTVKTFRIDIERDTATILMMFEPGARVPQHDHAGAEDSFVISGSCRIGETLPAQGRLPSRGRGHDTRRDRQR